MIECAYCDLEVEEDKAIYDAKLDAMVCHVCNDEIETAENKRHGLR